MFVFTCIIKKEKHLSRFIAVLLIRNKWQRKTFIYASKH